MFRADEAMTAILDTVEQLTKIVEAASCKCDACNEQLLTLHKQIIHARVAIERERKAH